MRQAADDDPAFPFLSRLAETVPAVADACAGGLPAGASPRGARLVRHKFGRRCLVRYAFACPGRSDLGVLGKASAKRLDERGHRTQLMLWQRDFGPGSGDAIGVPEPIGALPHLKMWFQREVAGRVATKLLEPDADPAPLGRIASGLAKLHRTHLPGERRWTIADEIEMLRRRLLDAARARPALREDILGVLHLCDRAADRVAERTDAGIHRDFYPDQVLVDGERVTILDLDLYARGDAAIDAGNFLAHMTELALRRHGDPRAFATLEDAFLSRFLALSPTTSPEAIETYAALTLARHISISLSIPERRSTTASLVQLSRERLERMLGHHGGKC